MARPASASRRGRAEAADTRQEAAPGQAGGWTGRGAAEATKIILGSKLVRAALSPGPPIKVGPGKVVYIGDYVLAADYDAPSVVVRRHGRDDAATQRTLAAYTGLRGAPIAYRDPTAVASPR